MSVIATTFRSRWGFHPCDHATYRKLKLLNLVYERAVRLAHAWDRWHRKAPHNRVCRRRLRDDQGRIIGYAAPVPLAEPPLCAVFSRKVQEQCFVDKLGNYSKQGYLAEKVVTDHVWIATDYPAARKPASAAVVRPLHVTIAEVDELYEQARACSNCKM